MTQNRNIRRVIRCLNRFILSPILNFRQNWINWNRISSWEWRWLRRKLLSIIGKSIKRRKFNLVILIWKLNKMINYNNNRNYKSSSRGMKGRWGSAFCRSRNSWRSVWRILRKWVLLMQRIRIKRGVLHRVKIRVEISFTRNKIAKKILLFFKDTQIIIMIVKFGKIDL